MADAPERTRGWRRRALLAVLAAILPLPPAAAQPLHQGEQLRIERTAGTIQIDGHVDEEAWAFAERVEQFYEFSPGDNVAPPARTVAWLAYDDRYFYAAFEFLDPNRTAIRAPYADRDRISSNATDYGGLVLDSRNDGRTALVLMVSASGVQYDSVLDDAAGENASPDFFFDSAARMTGRGWTLEIRVPFSSLRYSSVDPQTWGIALYRNYPREFRYQIASTRVPRGSNCTVCLINTLVGLEGLPSQTHLAQYAGTRRNPALFQAPMGARSGIFSGSALFAYKINWQSVVFVGYGDDRELSEIGELERISSQFFAKFSYAFQR